MNKCLEHDFNIKDRTINLMELVCMCMELVCMHNEHIHKSVNDLIYKIIDHLIEIEPTQEEMIQYLDMFINMNDSKYMKYLVKNIKIDITNLIHICQESTPKPFVGNVYPRSGRPFTMMKRILLSPPSKIDYNKSWNFEIEQNSTSFCIKESIGLKTNLYIPITRYGKSPGMGFYGKEELVDPMFTWYYIEPDSDFVLYAPQIFISRNKFQAFLVLYNLLEENIKQNYLQYREKVLTCIDKYLDIVTHDNTNINIFLEGNESVIGSASNFFRNITNKCIYFEYGAMDFLDESLSDMMRHIGYDILVLTHQPGNYGRLVSECLDVRKRSTSFSNIYKICINEK
jgi:hypothetical protein